MDTQKQQIVERLTQANNILVTVSNNPSVDQLAACIGLTLALNKMKKHATAVFSGAIPPIIEFLQPEKTLEKTTDSLRDFIIAIDKAKADKLRYKVEDKFVKIFITPYRTSISQKDLEFSEGDFNVDVVLALGVHKQTDLDQAITAHGRILHDAAVISINTQPTVELGSINLIDPQASSLSEIAVELLDLLDKSVVDDQIATALLTGIVAETDRFRNAKTTPTTMSVSAELLTAGANQQLVASKLEAPVPPPPPNQQMGPTSVGQQTPPTAKSDDGTLEIDHNETADKQSSFSTMMPPDDPTLAAPKPPQIHIDEDGSVHPLDDNRNFNSEPKIMPLQQLPPLPPEPPMAPPPSAPFPPMGQQPAPGSTPFMQSPSNNTAGDFGLPPLPPAMNNRESGQQSMPYAASPMPSQGTSQLPQMPGQSSPPPMPTPPLAEQPMISPSIIQPEPNMAQPSQPAPPMLPPPPKNEEPPTIHTEGPHLMMQPPTFGSQLTAGTMPQEEEEPSGAALSLPKVENPGPLLEREPLHPQSVAPSLKPPVGAPAPSLSLPPPPPPKDAPSPATPVLGGGQTEPPLLAEESLSSLERDVKSPHLDYIESPVPVLPPPPSPAAPKPTTTPITDDNSSGAVDYDKVDSEQKADILSARSAIDAALQNDDTGDSSLDPVISLNAQPLGAPLHEEPESPDAPPPGFSNDPHGGNTPPPPVPPPLIPPTPS
jgi:hypothetical protein